MNDEQLDKMREALYEAVKQSILMLQETGKPVTEANVIGNISILSYELMQIPEVHDALRKLAK